MNTALTNVNPNMNSQMMLDNLKSMMLTMAMVKGSTQSDNSNSSFMNTVLIMLLVSFIDTFVFNVKKIFGIVSVKVEQYITSKTNNIAIINKLTSSINKVKKSSIKIKIENTSKNPTSEAIIDTLTNLPYIKCVILQNGTYNINYSEEIEVSKNVYAQLVNTSAPQMTTSVVVVSSDKNTDNSLTTDKVNQEPSAESSKPEFQYIDIYSYTMDMEGLRNEINTMVKHYLIKMTNKLGNNIYYFSELPLQVYRTNDGKIDYSKVTQTLHFSMKPFVTNRSFKNLFGKNIDIIRKRVEFFRDNKDWYDSKGVPYTLGVLVSGNPGSGKTSTIKCIANELKRHIINIHLSDNMTKTQIENLFYSEQLHITTNGKTDIYTIPIEKRIYVLEDVDCQCDIILDRGDQSLEQKLVNENIMLKDEIEQLKFALSEISNGKKMVMTNNNAPKIDTKKSESSSEKITLSFLLNLFDGVLETPGRITFMTTNFISKLDKAFTRPGRIDVISKFGVADHSQMIDIIEHRYDTKLTEDQLNIVNNIYNCINPAEIGRILFENFNDLDGALKSLIDYANEYLEEEAKKVEEKRKTEEQAQEKLKLNEDFKKLENVNNDLIKHFSNREDNNPFLRNTNASIRSFDAPRSFETSMSSSKYNELTSAYDKMRNDSISTMRNDSISKEVYNKMRNDSYTNETKQHDNVLEDAFKSSLNYMEM
jgi:hypothetical protein